MYHFAILSDKEYTYDELKRYFKIFNDHVYSPQHFEMCKSARMNNITNDKVIIHYLRITA